MGLRLWVQIPHVTSEFDSNLNILWLSVFLTKVGGFFIDTPTPSTKNTDHEEIVKSTESGNKHQSINQNYVPLIFSTCYYNVQQNTAF